MDILKSYNKLLFLFIVLFYACEQKENDFTGRPFTKNSLFPGTERIIVNEFSYYNEYNQLVIVDGDSATMENPDTFPTRPSFSWESTGSKLVNVAVFNSRIEVNNNGIVNINNIVWMWNTGMNTGVEGSISYYDGKSVENGILLEKDKLRPLYSDSLYTWAIWAWNESGTKITKSSRELGFIVK